MNHVEKLRDILERRFGVDMIGLNGRAYDLGHRIYLELSSAIDADRDTESLNRAYEQSMADCGLGVGPRPKVSCLDSDTERAYRDLIAAVYGDEHEHTVFDNATFDRVFADATDYIKELEGTLASTERVLELAEEEIDELHRGPDEPWRI